MRRYLKLYLYFLRFSFSKAMEFRLDFLFRVVMDALLYVVQFLFFNIIYLHTPVLAGWTLDDVRVFIAGYLFIDAFHMTIFANNCWWFPINVNRGHLDYYLTKPVSTLFFLSTREFAANSFLNLILASGLLAWSINLHPENFNWQQVSLYVILLINGAFLYFIMHMIFLMSVFWTQSPRGFGDLFYSVSKTMERPDRLFHGAVRKIFLFILPFILMASYPARIFLEKDQNHLLPYIFTITIIFFGLLLILWKQGLKNYSSASS